ncbi:MAG: hypothetical protein LUB59_01835, partial [Candidatus Gastranaerophilales bacterium]|nr:hypothetical protein [Candidatus Gastranaerophilales bacterium]
DKNNAVILSFLGLLYLNTGLFKKAEKNLEKSVNIKQNRAATEGLGLVKFYLGKYKEAGKYLSEAIENNKSFDIYDKYIRTLIELGSYSKSYDYAIECYKKYPLKKESLDNLTLCCIHTGRLKEAAKYSEQLVNKYPKYGMGWIRFGLINEMFYHNETLAKKCYQKALKYGEKYDAYYNLAVNANKARDVRKAKYYAKKIYKYSFDKGAMNFLFSTIYFQQRKFKQGFRYYSKKELNIDPANPVSKLKRLWDGKTYRNETLLIYCDQGIGDIIMFSRYLPFLKKKFKKIKVFTSKSTVELFKRSFSKYSNMQFIGFKEHFPVYDKSVVLSNLPYYLKTDIDEIPSKDGYITFNINKYNEYKQKYFNTGELKAGICWEAGAAGWREQLNRTLHISFFEPLFGLKNIQFYSFQVNPSLNNYKKYENLIDLGKTFRDFDDTAAALKNLDILVTVDTSVAHLAGALGVKTFMLLPYCPDWRWFDCEDSTDWYNSVKIFKQKETLFWDNEIERIKSEISKML